MEAKFKLRKLVKKHCEETLQLYFARDLDLK